MKQKECPACGAKYLGLVCPNCDPLIFNEPSHIRWLRRNQPRCTRQQVEEQVERIARATGCGH